jgi:hypothetical protein
MSKLAPSRLFLGVGPDSIIPRGSMSLPVIFRTPENYHTESIVFNVVEVNLPFNAILDMPALYQLMAIARYGYLVLKMPLPRGIIKVQGDRTGNVSTLEKLQALAATHEAAAGYGE